MQNRIELLSLELQEERIRVKRQIALGTAGAMLGVTGLIGLGILIVYLMPAEERVFVATIVVALFIVTAIVLLLVAKALADRHTPFEATLATLNKDMYRS